MFGHKQSDSWLNREGWVNKRWARRRNIPFTGQINLGCVALVKLLVGLLGVLDVLRLGVILSVLKVLLGLLLRLELLLRELLALLLELRRELVAGSFFLHTKLDFFSSFDTGVLESGGDSSIFPFDA